MDIPLSSVAQKGGVLPPSYSVVFYEVYLISVVEILRRKNNTGELYLRKLPYIRMKTLKSFGVT